MQSKFIIFNVALNQYVAKEGFVEHILCAKQYDSYDLAVIDVLSFESGIFSIEKIYTASHLFKPSFQSEESDVTTEDYILNPQDLRKITPEERDITYNLNTQSTPKPFQTITESIQSLLEYKNSKYGNAALEPLNIFADKAQVGQRLDDKLSRIKNSKELRKNDVADLIGYLILECEHRGWNNFDEFKD